MAKRFHSQMSIFCPCLLRCWRLLWLAHLAWTVVTRGQQPGCPVGLLPPDCSRSCGPGTFGLNCASACPSTCQDNLCQPDTGFCLKCRVGFRGAKCTHKCRSGYFGRDCQTRCPVHCLQQRCDPFYGNCQDCQPGYQGARCEERSSSSELVSLPSQPVRPSSHQVDDQGEADERNFLLYAIIIIIGFTLPACIVSVIIYIVKRKVRDKNAALKRRLSSEQHPIYRGKLNQVALDPDAPKTFPRGMDNQETPNRKRPQVEAVKSQGLANVTQGSRKRNVGSFLSNLLASSSENEKSIANSVTLHPAISLKLGRSVSLQTPAEQVDGRHMKRFLSDSLVERMNQSQDDELDTPKLHKIMKKNTPLRPAHAANYSRDLFFKTQAPASMLGVSLSPTQADSRDNRNSQCSQVSGRRSQMQNSVVVPGGQDLALDTRALGKNQSRETNQHSASKSCRTTHSEATVASPRDVLVTVKQPSESTFRSKGSWRSLLKLSRSRDRGREPVKDEVSPGHRLKVHKAVSDSQRSSYDASKSLGSKWRKIESAPYIPDPPLGPSVRERSKSSNSNTAAVSIALDETISGVYRETTQPLTPPVPSKDSSRAVSEEHLKPIFNPKKALRLVLQAVGVRKRGGVDKAHSDLSRPSQAPPATDVSGAKSEPSCSGWNESATVEIGTTMDVNNAGCRNGDPGDSSEPEVQTDMVRPDPRFSMSRSSDGAARPEFGDTRYRAGTSQSSPFRPIACVTDPIEDQSLSSDRCKFKTIFVDSSLCLLERGVSPSRYSPAAEALLSYSNPRACGTATPDIPDLAGELKHSDRHPVIDRAVSDCGFDRARSPRADPPQYFPNRVEFYQVKTDATQSVDAGQAVDAATGDIERQREVDRVCCAGETASDPGYSEKTSHVILRHADGSGYTDRTTHVIQSLAGSYEYQDETHRLFQFSRQPSPRSRPHTLRDVLSQHSAGETMVSSTSDLVNEVQQDHRTVKSPGPQGPRDAPSIDDTRNNKSPLPTVPPGPGQGSRLPKAFYPMSSQGTRHSRGGDHRVIAPPWSLFPTHTYPGPLPIPLYNIKNLRRRAEQLRPHHTPHDIFLKIALAVPKSSCNTAHYLFSNTHSFDAHLVHNRSRRRKYPVEFDQMDTDLMTLSPPKSQESQERLNKVKESKKTGEDSCSGNLSEGSGASAVKSMIANCLRVKKTHPESKARRSASLTTVLDSKTALKRQQTQLEPAGRKAKPVGQNRGPKAGFEDPVESPARSPQCVGLWQAMALQNENIVERTSPHDQHLPPEHNAIKLTLRRMSKSEKQYELVSKCKSPVTLPLLNRPEDLIYPNPKLSRQHFGDRPRSLSRHSPRPQMPQGDPSTDLSAQQSVQSDWATEDEDDSEGSRTQTEPEEDREDLDQSSSLAGTLTTTTSMETPVSKRKGEKGLHFQTEQIGRELSEKPGTRMTGDESDSSASSTQDSDSEEEMPDTTKDSLKVARSGVRTKEVTFSKPGRKRLSRDESTEGEEETAEDETTDDSNDENDEEKMSDARSGRKQSCHSGLSGKESSTEVGVDSNDETASPPKDQLTIAHAVASVDTPKTHNLEVKTSAQPIAHSHRLSRVTWSKSADEVQGHSERETSGRRRNRKEGGEELSVGAAAVIEVVAGSQGVQETTPQPKEHLADPSSAEIVPRVCRCDCAAKRPPTAQRVERDRRQSTGQKLSNKSVNKTRDLVTSTEDPSGPNKITQELRKSPTGAVPRGSPAEKAGDFGQTVTDTKVCSPNKNTDVQESPSQAVRKTDATEDSVTYASPSAPKTGLSSPPKQVSRSPTLPAGEKVVVDDRKDTNRGGGDVKKVHLESGSEVLNLKNSSFSVENSRDSPLHLSACLDISFKKWDCVARAGTYPLPSLLEIVSRVEPSSSDSSGTPINALTDEERAASGKMASGVSGEEDEQANYLSFVKEESKEPIGHSSFTSCEPQFREPVACAEHPRSSVEYKYGDWNYELDASAVIFSQSAFSTCQSGSVENAEFQSIAEEDSECFYDALENLGSSKALIKASAAVKEEHHGQHSNKKSGRLAAAADVKSGADSGCKSQHDLRLVFNFKESGKEGTSARTGQNPNTKIKNEPRVALRFAAPNVPKHRSGDSSGHGNTRKPGQEPNKSMNWKSGRRKDASGLRSPALLFRGQRSAASGTQGSKTGVVSSLCGPERGSPGGVDGEGREATGQSSPRPPSPGKASSGSQSLSSSKDDLFCSIEDN